MLKPKPLKILFITSWYPTKEKPSNGIFIKNHARAASLYNNRVVIMHNLGCDRSIKRFYEFSDQEEEGFRIIRIKYRPLPMPKTSYLSYLWSSVCAFRWLVKRAGFKPDIIHAHVFTAGVLAIILGKIHRTPVIITEHYTEILKNKLNKREKLEFKFAMDRADIILPVSESLKNAILRYGIKNRIQVIANTINMNDMSPPSFRETIGNRKKILFIGFLIARKGIPRLLQALSQLIKKRNDFELDIVGDGPEKRNYEKLALRLGLEEIVKFHGMVTDTAKNEFLKRCSFLVLSSSWENFGVVLIEAMSCGKPVIASARGGPKEIINKKTGIIIPPEDIEALARAIEHMLDHYKDYVPEEIIRYVHERFSYKVIGDRLDRIYRDLISKRFK